MALGRGLASPSWAVALLVAAAAMSGCLGFGDDSDTDSDGDDETHAPPTGNETAPPPTNGTTTSPPPTNNTTAPAPPGNGTFPPPTDGNQTTNTTLAWSYDNRTGTVSGTALLLIGSSSKDETFAVENGTALLFLNFTVQGSAVDVEITPPGCDDDACRISVDVSSGAATYTTDDPVEGSWTVTFSSTTTIGPYSTDYALAIALATMVHVAGDEEEGGQDPDNEEGP
jgi:hypothetical protein